MVSRQLVVSSKQLTHRPGTVISIYETPFPSEKGHLQENEKLLLPRIRRNLRNVLMHLSKAGGVEQQQDSINKLAIRPGLLSNQSTVISSTDSPSLLFYYLFDDWYASYALIASEHQYAQLLEKLVRSK